MDACIVASDYMKDRALCGSWHTVDGLMGGWGCTCAYRFHKGTGSVIPPEPPLATVGSNSLSRELGSMSSQQLRQSLSPRRHRSNESATSWFQRVITQLNADVVNFSTLNVVTRAKVCPSHVWQCCDVFTHSDKKICIFLKCMLLQTVR